MTPESTPSWAFLTNHGQVLVCIARDPGIRLRDLGERVSVTERAAHRIVAELAAAGYITRERTGRRNRYTINAHSPVPDPIVGEHKIGELLEILLAKQERSFSPPAISETDALESNGHPSPIASGPPSAPVR
ncbi:MAG: MarR family winged helix-turn-helix transcriptional regulator [Solirubrobacteraceae bacterium]|jgi:hypothetical protein